MTVGRLAKVLREAGRAQKRRGASESTVLKPSGRSKYGNRKTECRHWHTHDSKVEALRCNELHILQSGGAISGLEQQPVETDAGVALRLLLDEIGEVLGDLDLLETLRVIE